MASKATHRKTTVDVIKQQKKNAKRLAGQARQSASGVSAAASSTTSLAPSSQGNSAGANIASYLRTAGDTMIGPLAFWRGTNTSIYPSSSNNNTLDISSSTGSYSSHVIWFGSGSNTLEIISGAAFNGQILFLESTQTLTQTIKDRSNTSGGNTGNIKTLDGNDLALGTDKTIVLLMYSDVDSLWHQVSNPAGGGSGATRELDNLQNTAVNVHLLPTTSGNKNLGSVDKEWATLYLSSGLYFGTDQNSSTLNHTDGLLFNITDDNHWYEFQIDGDRKMSIGDTKTIIDGDLEPDTDNTRDIGSTSKAWKRIFAETGMEIFGTTGYLDLEGSSSYIVFSDGDDFKIKNASTGLEYEVATGDYHRFQVNNVTKFQVGGSSCSLDGGMFIGSADSVEVGYKVNNQALTVGSQGSMIHPYISNTENNPTDSDLNGWFGDQNGALGIQYYSTTGQHRIWIRSNDTWVKTFGT